MHRLRAGLLLCAYCRALQSRGHPHGAGTPMASDGGLGDCAPHPTDAAGEDGMKVEERLFSLAEVAERLGMSRYTIGEWLRSGRLTGRRIGRFWRVRESDLEAFMAQPTPLHQPTPASATPLWPKRRPGTSQPRRAPCWWRCSVCSYPRGNGAISATSELPRLPLAPLNALLAHAGYVIEAYEVQDPHALCRLSRAGWGAPSPLVSLKCGD